MLPFHDQKDHIESFITIFEKIALEFLITSGLPIYLAYYMIVLRMTITG